MTTNGVGLFLIAVWLLFVGASLISESEHVVLQAVLVGVFFVGWWLALRARATRR